MSDPENFAAGLLNEGLRQIADRHFGDLYTQNPELYAHASAYGQELAGRLIELLGEDPGPAATTLESAATKLVFLFDADHSEVTQTLPEDEQEAEAGRLELAILKILSADAGPNLQVMANQADIRVNHIMVSMEDAKAASGVFWGTATPAERLIFAAGFSAAQTYL